MGTSNLSVCPHTKTMRPAPAPPLPAPPRCTRTCLRLHFLIIMNVTPPWTYGRRRSSVRTTPHLLSTSLPFSVPILATPPPRVRLPWAGICNPPTHPPTHPVTLINPSPHPPTSTPTWRNQLSELLVPQGSRRPLWKSRSEPAPPLRWVHGLVGWCIVAAEQFLWLQQLGCVAGGMRDAKGRLPLGPHYGRPPPKPLAVTRLGPLS